MGRLQAAVKLLKGRLEKLDSAQESIQAQMHKAQTAPASSQDAPFRQVTLE